MKRSDEARSYALFPELEPRSDKPDYCYVCKVNTLRGHETTQRHRYLIRPKEYNRGSGDWLKPRATVMRDPYGETRDYENEDRERLTAVT